MLLTRILRYPVLLLSALLLSAHVVEAQTFDVAPDVTQAPLPAIEQPEGFTGLPPAAMPDLPAIEWRVANPFRFFSNPRDTEVHRATWLA